MDSKKLISVNEVKAFFASTHEFQVKEEGSNLRITYTDDNKSTSSLMWKQHMNVQQLIRIIRQLVWNHCNNIID